MLKKLIFLLVFLISMNIVLAATIHGSVYSPYLEQLKNAIIEINTSPKQTMVAKTGDYSFNVPSGAYTIKANYKGKETYSTEEKITVEKEGSYVLDLILAPDFSDTEDIGTDIEIPTLEKEGINYKIFLIPIIIAILVYLIVLWDKKHKKPVKEEPKQEVKESKETKKELAPDLDKLIEFIKKQGNRTTQKDIRKEFPMSEAKISLMIAELESKGKIQKIKKGRGNIIILK